MAVGRSENMRRIRSTNTTPEKMVRQAVREMGHFGYRLHRKDLPGKPDIAFVGRKKAIFINGCFWHGHDCRIGARKPKTNQHYWLPKIERTKQRDVVNREKLLDAGWRVLTVWECDIRNAESIREMLMQFLQ